MVDAGVHTLDGWDVLAVREKGIYVRGDGDPWLIVPHGQLMVRHDELAEAYRDTTGPYEDQ